MTKWINGKIIKIIHWNQNLFSVIINADINSFKAGQYAKISTIIKGKKIQRAYSYVNPPNNKNLEFYLVNVQNGQLSSKLFFMKKNDEITITKDACGFFTLDYIKSCENLWMLSTGTAIGPYLSILQDYNNQNIKKFKKIILIHAVRMIKDLSYEKLIKNLKNYYGDKLIVKKIVSRENSNYLCGRIPKLIQNRKIEKLVGFDINKNNSHVMICGNPDMVRDTQNFLIKHRGMSKNIINKKVGNISTENYW